MPDVYDSLLRLRTHTRREAQVHLRDAELERDRARARVSELRAGVARARSAVDPNDPESIGAYQAFRLREELRERREAARLQQREREVTSRSAQHVQSVRDELTLGAVIEHLDERRAHDARRAEARAMDVIAAGMRKAE